ncbi:MAG: T9SS type A sorting domain-containing protein [Fidelibacterota bacterium]|nr:MAG: T9SS type A sorting domain-containing protein [Candidatus Neomarinimicrobiota bacterium]
MRYKAGLTWMLAISSTSATIIDVPADSSTIQAGINGASNGDTILVQPGTYYENIVWPDMNGIKLISAGDTSNTIIDGTGNGSVIHMDPSTVTIDSTTEIQGFKITNGDYVYKGGGMFVSNASPVLTRLWITGNTAGSIGGGFYISGGSPTLTEVTVTGNTATEYGGGLYIHWYSSPTLTDVTVSGNTARSSGGLYIHWYSSPTLTDVTVSDNTASGAYGNGGGLSIFRSSPTLTGVTVTGNTATNGGGLFISWDSSPTLTGVTVTGNTATNGGGIYCGSSSPILVNAILWNDSPKEIYFNQDGNPSSITIAHSDVQGGVGSMVTNNNGTANWLEGNINTDPLFVDPENGDFHLLEGSPCIDAGTSFFVWDGDTLVNLNPEEYVGIAPDMGAFEYGALSIREEIASLPTEFTLYQNYPNPFNPVSIIRYELPQVSIVSLIVYDILGREVARLVDSYMEPGDHQVQWNAPELPSGVYIARLVTPEYGKSIKMLLLK